MILWRQKSWLAGSSTFHLPVLVFDNLGYIPIFWVVRRMEHLLGGWNNSLLIYLFFTAKMREILISILGFTSSCNNSSSIHY